MYRSNKGSRSLVRFVYNAVFWVFLLPFFTSIDYGPGFIAFTSVLALRFTANLATNNFLHLAPAQYEAFPSRIPRRPGARRLLS